MKFERKFLLFPRLITLAQKMFENVNEEKTDIILIAIKGSISPSVEKTV